MKLWVFTCSDSPFEHWLDGFKERFDAWADGGVRGLAVGRMAFLQEDGTTIPAWAPDPKVYEALGVDVPEQRPRDLSKEKKLHAMLDNAAERGWRLLIFAGGGPTAHVQDLMNAFPQVHGVIVDGPGENHYELAFHHGGELLEIRPGEEGRFAQVGAEIDRIQRGITHFRERLHNLTPEMVAVPRRRGDAGGNAPVRRKRGRALLAAQAAGALSLRLAVHAATGRRRRSQGGVGRYPAGRDVVIAHRTELLSDGGVFRLYLSETLFLAPRHGRHVRNHIPLGKTVAKVESVPERGGVFRRSEGAVGHRAAWHQLAYGHGDGFPRRILFQGGLQRDSAGPGGHR